MSENELSNNDKPIFEEQKNSSANSSRYSPMLFVLISLVVIFVSYQIIGGGLTFLFLDKENTNVFALRLATMLAQFIFLLAPTIYLIKRQHGEYKEVIRLRIPSIKESVFAIIGMFALLQFAEGYMFFQDKIPIPEKLQPFIEMIKRMIEETYRILIQVHSIPELLFVIVVVALTPAICEEILFRGLVQKNLSIASNKKIGFILTGIVFGLYHLNPFLAVPLISLGIYFSFLQYRSDSIILPMIAHFLNNTISVIGVYIYGVDAITGKTVMGDVTDISNLTMLGTMALFGTVFALTMWFYNNETKKRVEKKIDG